MSAAPAGPPAAQPPAPQPAATTEAAPAAVQPQTQSCPVCSAVASLDAFFCESCGYDFLTGSLPRSAAQPEVTEVDSEPEAVVTAAEAAESKPDQAGEVFAEPASEPEPVSTGEAVEPEPEPVSESPAEPAIEDPPASVIEDPDEPAAEAANAVAEEQVAAATAQGTPADEPPVAATEDAGAEQTEPVPAPEPALPPVTTFDLGELPTHAPPENPLVVESAPRPEPVAPPPATSAADALSLGDVGRDLPNPDDLQPLNLPPRGPAPGQYSPPPPAPPRPGPGYPPPPAANRVPSQAPRPRTAPPPPAPRSGPLPQQPPPRPVPQPPRSTQQRPPAMPPGQPRMAPQPPAGPSRPPQPQPPATPPPATEPDAAPAVASPPASPRPTGPVLPSATGPARWVAEIWIDPEWYRVQQAPEQLPSPGQPLIQALRKQTNVVGRGSASGRPDLDCVTDTGVSRRQAVLTTDGIRWFVEDLGSSNGTYVGQVDQPMPTAPIKGRVELGHHDRIYVGSWTRIVVRPALVQEADL